MSFAITNKQFVIPASLGIPAAHAELADQTATTSAQNTGIVGLKWARVRVWIKTFGTLTAADTVRATLQVGTGTAITGPENIAQQNLIVETGDAGMTFDLYGWSNVGFQSWKVIFTMGSSHSFTADLYADFG